ncbi:MAG: type II toxin-antitoxin system Phd/YefM family antitoxin [Candidatus Riflebacteria bacterium]|nr:type II toxin-antitoxin system Phd/YefM family antitoxin [Candidatus Riflebacteria bacterium]
MNTTWKLQDAKAQFSKVVESALKIGPQYVTRHGQNAVVIIAADEYEGLINPKVPFNEFLMSFPKISDQSIFERTKDFPRDIEL